MDLGYALSEIGRHWRARQWWRKRFLTHVVSRYYALTDTDATPVVFEDWDTLLVLDACRYDLFAEALEDHPLPGTLTDRTALDSGTPGFLAANFGDGTFHDTVYVTANPYVSTDLGEDKFHAVDAVWRDDWDDELQTVRPETVAERALAAVERYPEKRLIVHFMQPHAPFIGETRLGERETFAIRETALGRDGSSARRRQPTPFERLGAGELTREAVWEAYRDNLDAALPAVEDLLTTLPGRTAVTADHGNALGEFARPFPIRVYGHPLGIHIPALTRVPWFVSDNGERKVIRAEPPVERTLSGNDADAGDGADPGNGPGDDDREGMDERTEKRLRMLGYVE
jgi:hypothetical protein